MTRIELDEVLSTRLCERIAVRWRQVQHDVAEVARQSGRQSDSVQIVGVTKYVGIGAVRALYAAGCRDFGESRPQQLWERSEKLSDLSGIRWHLIGHLQRNKVNRTIPHCHLIHSVDSERLLDAIDHAAKTQPAPCHVLLELKISSDATKHGLDRTQLWHVFESAPRWPHVQIRGLMGMASLDAGPSQSFHEFQSLHDLANQLQQTFPEFNPLQRSMGMSGDYRQAIQAGATLVRIGSHLWEGLEDD